jgi:hypothetical protein
MNTKYLVPLCAAVALMAACGQRESNPSMGGDSAGPADTTPSASGDTATTPGGNAGDASTTPGTPSTPAQNPPAETPPVEPPPTSN